MKRNLYRRGMLIVLVCAVLLPVVGRAQTDDESNGAVQFNFSTPGARSLALGGAFLGAADDATAAYTNPAGLLQLSESEVSIEGRRWQYSTAFADRGRASGVPSGFGADTLAAVENGTAESELSGVSFASFVYPRPKWAAAVYYHQVANFETQFDTQGIFLEDARLRPAQVGYDLDVNQLGISVAGRLQENFLFGVGVSSYSFNLDSLTQRFQPRNFFAAPDFTRDLKVNFQQQNSEGTELGFSAGFLWQLTPKVTLGGAYRFGPEFELSVRSSTGSPDLPVSQRQVVEGEAVFSLPDVYGMGFSIRPNDSWTINLDYNRIEYSDLVDDGFFVIFAGSSGERLLPEDFVTEDATEIRFGAEYVFSNFRLPIALRFGAWFDPEHRLRYEGPDEGTAVRLFEGDDEVHFSAGIGFVLSSRFQLDLGVDFSEIYDTASVSLVHRF